MADDARSMLAIEDATEAPNRKLSRVRKLVLAGAIAAAVALALGLFLQWQFAGAHRETTNNAYVKADISVVSAQVEGYVRALHVQENQVVRAGDVIAEIDPSEYEAAVARARAAVARARAQVVSNAANRTAAAAQLSRYQFLAERGLLSSAGLDTARAQSGQWGGATAAAQADVDVAEAELAAAQLNLSRTIIRSPIDGIVGNRTAQVGQLLRPGTPLLAVVPHTLYVEANFKETQIARMRPGQSVTVRPDVDRSMRLHGVVDSIAPASGSEFSFIPTETATGNFTKIVQRVPVRIRLDETPEARGLLRPGLSVTVTVDTRGGS